MFYVAIRKGVTVTPGFCRGGAVNYIASRESVLYVAGGKGVIVTPGFCRGGPLK